MRDSPDQRGYGYVPGEDVRDKARGWRIDRDKPPEYQTVDELHEAARALWAIAAVLDELRHDHIDGP